MRNLHITTPGFSAKETDSAINMVIAYDSRPALARANNLKFDLAQRFHGEVTIEATIWNFILLGHPELRRLAADEAAGAAIVVISAAEPLELPPCAQTWLEDWMARIGHQGAALVGLLDNEESLGPDPWILRKRLRRQAEKAGVNFFCDASEIPIPLVHPRVDDKLPASRISSGDWIAGLRGTEPCGVSRPRDAIGVLMANRNARAPWRRPARYAAAKRRWRDIC